MLSLRAELKSQSDRGECGARAIRDASEARGDRPAPPLGTINRRLERRGAPGGRRARRPAPPPGWYRPGVAARREEPDSFDIVEGPVIKGGVHVEVLNATALHGGLVGSWPMAAVTAEAAVDALIEHWRAAGPPGCAVRRRHDLPGGAPARGRRRPGHAAVPGPGHRPGVRPAPGDRVPGGHRALQRPPAGRGPGPVHPRVAGGPARGSARCAAAGRARAAARIEAAPHRRPWPEGRQPGLQAHPLGRIVCPRRTGERGAVGSLGRRFAVAATWRHRLVRAEADLDAGRVRSYALRRREPGRQPLLREVAYRPPRRGSSE